MSAKAMRVFLSVATVITLVIPAALPPAGAVTPLVVVKPMSLIANLDPAESAQGLLVRKTFLFVFGTRAGETGTTDGFVRAFAESGTEAWNLALDTGGDDIATAAGLDPFGNIWVAGTSAPQRLVSDSVTTDFSTALNPDSVTVVTKNPLRGDPNLVTLWLISPQGELLATYSKDVGRSILVKGISASAATISVVGVASTALGTAGFLTQSTRKGVFGKMSLIGNRDTEINGIVKSGKSLFLLGSSSETLFGKARSGIKDAVIMTYSSTGTFSSILRSFNTGATRTWQSGTSAKFFTGDTLTGSNSEAVVTRYSSTFSPIWTARFESVGPALAPDSSLFQFVAFASRSAIVGVKSWKPGNAQLIALTFDKTGRITQAFKAKGLVRPISASYSQELGVVLLGRGPAGVSIFHVLTR